MKTPSLLLFSSFCAVVVFANSGCGSDETPAAGGKGGSSGKAGASGKGGTSGSGGASGSAGTGGTGGSTGGTGGSTGGTGGSTGGTGGSAPCTTGAMRCNGNTRESCTSAGTWQADATQCSGATPTCTGAGVCAAYQLSGQIDTFGPYSAQANGPTYILREQTLLEYPQVCGSTYCVSGGIKP